MEYKALIDIGDEVVVQVLGVVLLGACQSHPLRYILTLIHYIITLYSLVLHRLIQDFLDIHRSTHLLLLVY